MHVQVLKVTSARGHLLGLIGNKGDLTGLLARTGSIRVRWATTIAFLIFYPRLADFTLCFA